MQRSVRNRIVITDHAIRLRAVDCVLAATPYFPDFVTYTAAQFMARHNVIDYILGLRDPLMPALRDLQIRATEAWHEALDVSGHDCSACGRDSTYREVIDWPNVYCPSCASIKYTGRCARCGERVMLADTATELRDERESLVCNDCTTRPS